MSTEQAQPTRLRADEIDSALSGSIPAVTARLLALGVKVPSYKHTATPPSGSTKKDAWLARCRVALQEPALSDYSSESSDGEDSVAAEQPAELQPCE